MAAIQERRAQDGTVHYRVLLRLHGHPPQSATFKRKTDAKRWAQQTEAAIREGRHFKTREAKRHTLADLVDRYLRDVLPSKPKSRKKLSALLTWWRREIGAYSLADVTPALIVEQRDRLLRGRTNRHARRSPATVNRHLGALSHAFTIAVREWGWVEDNPVRKVGKLTEPTGRVRFLTDEERDRLLEACGESGNRDLYVIVVLALSTGARLGEIMALRWPDVDLARGLAILHETKNKERRALPLAGLALNLLRERSRRRRLVTDLVFPSLKNARRTVFPRRAWLDALKAAQVEDFRFHDLRHSAASYLAMSGATLAEIAAVLGHKTLAMVKRYSHLSEQHTCAVVARMNEKFLGGASNRDGVRRL